MHQPSAPSHLTDIDMLPGQRPQPIIRFGSRGQVRMVRAQTPAWSVVVRGLHGRCEAKASLPLERARLYLNASPFPPGWSERLPRIAPDLPRFALPGEEPLVFDDRAVRNAAHAAARIAALVTRPRLAHPCRARTVVPPRRRGIRLGAVAAAAVVFILSAVGASRWSASEPLDSAGLPLAVH